MKGEVGVTHTHSGKMVGRSPESVTTLCDIAISQGGPGPLEVGYSQGDLPSKSQKALF